MLPLQARYAMVDGRHFRLALQEMRKMSVEQRETLHSKGIAVGWSDIAKDALVFEFRGERFEFPTIQASPVAQWNGYFYTAKVAELRAMQKGKDGRL